MLKHKGMKIFAIGLLFAGLATAAMAQRNRRWTNQNNQRWVYLGEANVDGRADHDMIRVGREDGRFRQIQLRIERGAIEFDRVVVHYANGTNEEVALRNRIPSGGQTRAIDLRGNDRAINGVEVWYAKANNWSRQPRIRLYGR